MAVRRMWNFHMTKTFLQVHFSFSSSGQIKITPIFFPICLQRRLGQRHCPFQCFIKQEVCLTHTTSVVTAMTLGMGTLFSYLSHPWIHTPSPGKDLPDAFITHTCCESFAPLCHVTLRPCAGIWSIMCKWLNRFSAMGKKYISHWIRRRLCNFLPEAQA